METNDICKILLNAAVYVPLFCALCTAVFAPFFGNKSSKALAVLSSGVSLFAAAVLYTQRTLPTRRASRLRPLPNFSESRFPRLP